MVSGSELKRVRQEAGLTLKQVASLYDYAAPATAWQWENEGWKKGRGTPPPNDILQKIAFAGKRNNLDLQAVNNVGEDEEVERDDEGVPSFGEWLRQEREEKLLTVKQLATNAGVSLAQIHNIENGRTVNPQKETRNRLSAALDLIVPGEIIRKSESASKIEGLGSLEDFDPYDYGLLPQQPGVYVLYDVSQRPIYVGKAANIAQRIRTHSDKFWFKRPLVQTGSFIEVPHERLRHQLEQVLIKFMKSNAIINKQSVSRSEEDEF